MGIQPVFVVSVVSAQYFFGIRNNTVGYVYDLVKGAPIADVICFFDTKFLQVGVTAAAKDLTGPEFAQRNQLGSNHFAEVVVTTIEHGFHFFFAGPVIVAYLVVLRINFEPIGASGMGKGQCHDKDDGD